jgi:hypothetical protein
VEKLVSTNPIPRASSKSVKILPQVSARILAALPFLPLELQVQVDRAWVPVVPVDPEVDRGVDRAWVPVVPVDPEVDRGVDRAWVPVVPVDPEVDRGVDRAWVPVVPVDPEVDPVSIFQRDRLIQPP